MDFIHPPEAPQSQFADLFNSVLSATSRVYGQAHVRSISIHTDRGEIQLDVPTTWEAPSSTNGSGRCPSPGCFIDCFKILLAADRNLTRQGVLAALDAAETPWSESQVGAVLAWAVQVGVLGNQQKGTAKGYGLPTST